MNTICHIEIMTKDLDRAQAFYAGVFENWTFRSFIPGMTIFGVGETHIGGLMLADEVTTGNSPSVWVQVEDLDATLSRVLAKGGTVTSEKSEVPSVGWSAAFADPEGSPIGVVQYT